MLENLVQRPHNSGEKKAQAIVMIWADGRARAGETAGFLLLTTPLPVPLPGPGRLGALTHPVQWAVLQAADAELSALCKSRLQGDQVLLHQPAAVTPGRGPRGMRQVPSLQIRVTTGDVDGVMLGDPYVAIPTASGHTWCDFLRNGLWNPYWGVSIFIYQHSKHLCSLSPSQVASLEWPLGYFKNFILWDAHTF